MRGYQTRNLPASQQMIDAHPRLVRVVLDKGQVARAIGDQGVDQGRGSARDAEAANHDRITILDHGNRGVDGSLLVG